MIDQKDESNQVTLTPLGVTPRPRNKEEVRRALVHICTALFGLHDLGYMHCDVRWANIIDYCGTYYRIDCEHACHRNEIDVRTQKSRLIKPAFVLHVDEMWEPSHDLYQVAKLFPY
jgi:hypothetical protein